MVKLLCGLLATCMTLACTLVSTSHALAQAPAKTIYKCSLDPEARSQRVESLSFEITQNGGSGPWRLEGKFRLLRGTPYSEYFDSANITDTPRMVSGGKIVIKAHSETVKENPSNRTFTIDPKSFKGIYEYEQWVAMSKWGKPDIKFEAAMKCVAY